MEDYYKNLFFCIPARLGTLIVAALGLAISLGAALYLVAFLADTPADAEIMLPWAWIALAAALVFVVAHALLLAGAAMRIPAFFPLWLVMSCVTSLISLAYALSLILVRRRVQMRDSIYSDSEPNT